MPLRDDWAWTQHHWILESKAVNFSSASALGPLSVMSSVTFFIVMLHVSQREDTYSRRDSLGQSCWYSVFWVRSSYSVCYACTLLSSLWDFQASWCVRATARLKLEALKTLLSQICVASHPDIFKHRDPKSSVNSKSKGSSQIFWHGHRKSILQWAPSHFQKIKGSTALGASQTNTKQMVMWNEGRVKTWNFQL